MQICREQYVYTLTLSLEIKVTKEEKKVRSFITLKNIHEASYQWPSQMTTTGEGDYEKHGQGWTFN